MLPDHRILETVQDRLLEKKFVAGLGIGTAAYADVASAQGLREAINVIGLPAMKKTRRFGYDGKGQAIIRADDDLDQVWDDLGTKSAIVETFVQFEREISRNRRARCRWACRMFRRDRERAPRSHLEIFARAGRDF